MNSSKYVEPDQRHIGDMIVSTIKLVQYRFYVIGSTRFLFGEWYVQIYDLITRSSDYFTTVFEYDGFDSKYIPNWITAIQANPIVRWVDDSLEYCGVNGVDSVRLRPAVNVPSGNNEWKLADPDVTMCALAEYLSDYTTRAFSLTHGNYLDDNFLATVVHDVCGK